MFKKFWEKIKEYNSINLANALLFNTVAVAGFYLFFSGDFWNTLKSVSTFSAFLYVLFFGVYLYKSKDIESNPLKIFKKRKIFDSKAESKLQEKIKSFTIKS